MKQSSRNVCSAASLRPSPMRRVGDLQGCCTAYGDHFQRHVNEAGIARTIDGLFAQRKKKLSVKGRKIVMVPTEMRMAVHNKSA